MKHDSFLFRLQMAAVEKRWLLERGDIVMDPDPPRRRVSLEFIPGQPVRDFMKPETWAAAQDTASARARRVNRG